MPKKKTLKSAVQAAPSKPKQRVAEPTIVSAAGAAAAQAGEKIQVAATAAVPEEPVAAAVAADIAQAASGPTLGQSLEQAMAQAIRDTQAESEAIAAGPGDEADKQARIATLNDPVAVQARMMAYREKALTEHAEPAR